MEHLSQFILTHWQLCLIFVIILALALGNEWYSQAKRAKMLSPAEVIEQMNNEQAVVFDIRDNVSFRSGHIIHAIHATPDDFTNKRMEQYKTQPIVLACAKGLQSATLASQLRAQGFTQLFVLSGGMNAWQAAELPIVKSKK